MPTYDTPIKLNKFYQLDLTATRNAFFQVDWNTLGKSDQKGAMQVRSFFVNPNWENDIHSFDVSEGGAKGGVYFLYKEDPNTPGTPAAMPSFVVKGTQTPQQTLFAEYVLKRLGQAKVPRSLVLEVDSVDGTKLRNIIDDDMKAHPTNLAPHLGQPHTKTENRNNFLRNLTDDDYEHARPTHLIVQKLFTGSTLVEAGADLKEWLQAKGLVLTVTYDELTNNGTDFTGIDARFRRIVEEINQNKLILSNQDSLFNAGCLLAVDTLIGNHDRFEAMNFANAFFITRPAAPPKVANPVGAIDNDAFLPRYIHKGILDSIPNGTPQEKYLTYLLANGQELETTDIAPQLLPRVQSLLEDFDGANVDAATLNFVTTEFNYATADSFAMTRYNELLSDKDRHKLDVFRKLFYKLLPPSFPLLAELYNDDGTMSANLGLQPSVNPGTVPVFRNNITDPAWQTVRRHFKRGFCEGLSAIKRMVRDELKSYRSIYAGLAGSYGETANFDWTAFEVRARYMAATAPRPDPQLNWSINFSGHPKAVSSITENYLNRKQENPINQALIDALTFGVKTKLISPQEQDKIKGVVQFLTDAEQEQIIPKVTGVNKPDYTNRVNAVRCAVAKFYARQAKLLEDPSQQAQYLQALRLTQPFVQILEEAKFYKRGDLLVKLLGQLAEINDKQLADAIEL